MMYIEKFPSVRKHTISFLEYSKKIFPVTLTSEIDMSQIILFKNNFSLKLSYVTFLTYIISRVIKNYTQACSIYKSGIHPKLIRNQNIHAKLTFNKLINNENTVMSATLEKSNEMSLTEIQNQINFYKTISVQEFPTYPGLRILQRLPQILSNYLFKMILAKPFNKTKTLGTFAITSLGHQPIDTFIPLSGTTLTFGVGQVRPKPCISGEEIVVKSTLTLSMVFDHRVLDGFLAAKILSEIKYDLEHFNP